jgi:uncharacterized protein YdeI (YjbR/CyaY-like superfamily)
MIADQRGRPWQVPMSAPEPTFFETPADFRGWFEEHADTAPELWVGFHRKATGRRSITWPEAVDEALCVGWIDGLRRSLDADSYMIRFTPRKARSTWSAVNIRRARELIAEGRMRRAGRAAFERRTDERSGIYSYEQRDLASLSVDEQDELDGDEAAREFWHRQPAGYRKTVTWWIVSARRPETRARRLARLIAESAAGRRIRELTSPADRERRT